MKNVIQKISLFSLLTSFVILSGCASKVRLPQNIIVDNSNDEIINVEEQINSSSTLGVFSNKKFGISFEYPEEWESNELNHDINQPEIGVKWFDINNRTPELGRAPYLRNGEILIEFYYYPTDLAIEEWFTKYDSFTNNGLEELIESIL